MSHELLEELVVQNDVFYRDQNGIDRCVGVFPLDVSEDEALVSQVDVLVTASGNRIPVQSLDLDRLFMIQDSQEIPLGSQV